MKRFNKNRLFSLRTVTVSLFVTLFCFLVLGSTVLAQTDAAQQAAAAAGLSQTPLGVIIARLIRTFLSVLGIILVILVLYAGWLWMSSQGDAKKIDKAQSILKQAVIGLVIILSSYAITTFILNRLLEAAGLGGISATVARRYIEPLSGALGSGIIKDHYPARGAIDIPRNTKIFVTFKESVDPNTLIVGFDKNNPTTPRNLKDGSVVIYPTAQGESAKLAGDKVLVTPSSDFKVYTFDPVDLLGREDLPVNYTVNLTGNLKRCSEVTAPGVMPFECKKTAAAFSGNGYSWIFTVSTVIDLTPPKVVSVIPAAGSNITVEITFDEAMNPVATTGTYDSATRSTSHFNNIQVSSLDPEAIVDGTFAVSNGYKTVDFTTTEVCGKDPCGDFIYCLPGGKNISVEAVAAALDGAGPPALVTNGSYDGVTDAAGNSLDGDGDDQAEGPSTDNYFWGFSTSNTIDLTPPEIFKTTPAVNTGEVGVNVPVLIIFSRPMKASTLTSEEIFLKPSPDYEFWFVVGKNEAEGKTQAIINHPTLFSAQDVPGGYNYYPVITEDVKGSNQICLYPAKGPGFAADTSCGVSEAKPYCCNGVAGTSPCSPPY